MAGFNLNSPDVIVAMLASFIIATTIHEFMHAWTAWKLGDDTAASFGRLTLNPVVHFEPIGFIGMVLISLGFPFIGWGKPVPVVPSRFRHRFAGRRERGMALVAIAGPLSNVAQAFIVGLPLQYAIRNDHELGYGETLLSAYVLVNILLAAFNMIPVAPLDGSRVLMGLLPPFWGPILAPLERYGFMILFLLLFLGGGRGDSIVGGMYLPVRNTLFDLILFTL